MLTVVITFTAYRTPLSRPQVTKLLRCNNCLCLSRIVSIVKDSRVLSLTICVTFCFFYNLRSYKTCHVLSNTTYSTFTCSCTRTIVRWPAKRRLTKSMTLRCNIWNIFWLVLKFLLRECSNIMSATCLSTSSITFNCLNSIYCFSNCCRTSCTNWWSSTLSVVNRPNIWYIREVMTKCRNILRIFILSSKNIIFKHYSIGAIAILCTCRRTFRIFSINRLCWLM